MNIQLTEVLSDAMGLTGQALYFRPPAAPDAAGFTVDLLNSRSQNDSNLLKWR